MVSKLHTQQDTQNVILLHMFSSDTSHCVDCQTRSQFLAQKFYVKLSSQNKRLRAPRLFVDQGDKVAKHLQAVSRYRQHCVEVHSNRKLLQLFAMSVSHSIYTSILRHCVQATAGFRRDPDPMVFQWVRMDVWKGKIAGSIHSEGNGVLPPCHCDKEVILIFWQGFILNHNNSNRSPSQ